MRARRLWKPLFASLVVILAVLGLWYSGRLFFARAGATTTDLMPNGPRQAPGTAVVGIVAPDYALQIGDVFTVTVVAMAVDKPLSAFQFDLAYDPNLLDIVSTSSGAFLKTTGRNVVCPDPAETS